MTRTNARTSLLALVAVSQLLSVSAFAAKGTETVSRSRGDTFRKRALLVTTGMTLAFGGLTNFMFGRIEPVKTPEVTVKQKAWFANEGGERVMNPKVGRFHELLPNAVDGEKYGDEITANISNGRYRVETSKEGMPVLNVGLVDSGLNLGIGKQWTEAAIPVEVEAESGELIPGKPVYRWHWTSLSAGDLGGGEPWTLAPAKSETSEPDSD